MTTVALIQTIRRFKGKDGASAPEIAVTDDRGDVCATLKAIGENDVNNATITVALCRWRKLHAHAFLTRFEPTVDRTRKWLANVVVKDDSRILFLVRNSGQLVGHFGICNIDGECAELDNAIRGEAVGPRDLFQAVEGTLLQWCFCELGVKTVFARVLGTNRLALRLHRTLGFRTVSVDRLELHRQFGEDRLVRVPDGCTRVDAVNLHTLAMDHRHFFTLHSRTACPSD